jgi:RNA polymerase sigma-70 factor (ECF subfamily)
MTSSYEPGDHDVADVLGSSCRPALLSRDARCASGWEGVRWQNRGHFFGVSAQMMRRVLVDIARRRCAERRGGPAAVRVSLDDIDLAAAEPDAGLVAIDDALDKLAADDPRKARVVELRFFGGLSMEETAQTLGISLRTAHNDWAFARAWLYRELTRADDAS